MKKFLAASTLVLSTVLTFSAGIVSAPVISQAISGTAESHEVPQSVRDYLKAMETNDADLLWSSFGADKKASYDLLASYYYGYEPVTDDAGNTISPGQQAVRDAVAQIAAQGRTVTAQYVGKFHDSELDEYIYIVTFTTDGDVQSYSYTFFADDTGVTEVD